MKNKILISVISLFFLLSIYSINSYGNTNEVDNVTIQNEQIEEKIDENQIDYQPLILETNSSVNVEAPIQYKGAVCLDTPINNQNFTRPDDAKVRMQGWAVSDDANAKVRILVDGNVVSDNIKRVERADVNQIISPTYGGVANTPLAGFDEILDISGLTSGNHILKVEQISRYGESLGSSEININIVNKKYNGLICLDSPANNQNFTRPDDAKVRMQGWAVSDDANAKVRILVDGNVVSDNIKRVERADVNQIISPTYGGIANTPLAGFDEMIDISNLNPGNHNLKVEQISRYGESLSSSEININIVNKKYNGLICLDSPANNQNFTRPNDAKMRMQGWAVSDDANAKVRISVDGNVVSSNAKRVERADVNQIISPPYGGVANTPLAGFDETIDISSLNAGNHNIKIEQISRYGEILAVSEINIKVENKKYKGLVCLDSPGNNQNFTRPDDAKVRMQGWAVSDDANAKVRISVDGNIVLDNVKRVERADVNQIISPGYGGITNTPLAGFDAMVDISGLTAGAHSIKVEEISRYEELINFSEICINIANKKYNGEMCVDVPTINTSYETEDRLTVAGWAVSEDEFATIDIYIDNIFKATASRYVRPDVAYYVSKYGGKTVNPGFGTMIDCNGLSAGAHKLTVYEKSRYGDIIGGVEVQFIINGKQSINENDSESNLNNNTNNTTNTNINTSGTKGIDVSQYQGTIDWKSVANSGIKYAMIRIGYRGYGTGGFAEDTKFKTNFANAVENGLKVGVYFYSTSINTQEAQKDVEYIIRILKKYGYQNKVSMPIAIDLELIPGVNTRDKNVSKSMRTSIANTFCSTVANYGYTPMIYACKSFLNDNMIPSQIPYDIWVAQYNSKCTYKGKYTMWQYTSSGKISGISGNVDCNICYKDY